LGFPISSGLTNEKNAKQSPNTGQKMFGFAHQITITSALQQKQ